MLNIIIGIQIISGIITALLILAHEPKSEGLGGIGGSASHFTGVRTSADEKLDRLTWVFATAFMLCSALLGLGFIK